MKKECFWDGSGTCANGNCYDAKGPQGLELYRETAYMGTQPWCEQMCWIVGRPNCKRSYCCEGKYEGKGVLTQAKTTLQQKHQIVS